MDRARYLARRMSRSARGRWRMRAPQYVRAACALAGVVLCALWLAAPAGPPRHRYSGPVLRRLPLAYWMYRQEHPHKFKSWSCMTAPGPLHIQYVSGYWQRVGAPGQADLPDYYADDDAATHVLVFAAYWDGRAAPPHVRLIVHCDRELPLLYCHFWYYHTGVSQRSFAVDEGWTANGPRGGGTRLVSCPVPPAPAGSPPHASHAAPVAVSLERDVPCSRASTMLLIQHSPTAPPEGQFRWTGMGSAPARLVAGRQSVAVCAMWSRSGDASAALVEWLLMLHDMLVDRVYVYLPNAHENVLKVLEYFTWMYGPLVELTPFQRAPGAGDDRAPMLDCLYRARAMHGWVAILELDTMLLPIRDRTLPNFVAVSLNEASGGGDNVGDLVTRGVPGLVSAGAARVAGGVSGERGGDKAPVVDVFVLRRFLFPAGLQDSAPTKLLRPGRILAHDWREPHPLPDDTEFMTATLLNTATVVTIGANMSCVSGPCRRMAVAGEVARAHVYRARCRGGRRQCRALRLAAVRDRAARHWDVAAHANRTLQILHLRPRAHTELDDK